MSKSQDTKERIIKAVIKLGGEDDPYRISTLDVAEEAQTSEANIFKLFSSKINLLKSAFFYIDTQIENELHPSFPRTASTEEFLAEAEKVWESYFQFFLTHREYTPYYAKFKMSPNFDTANFLVWEVIYKEFNQTIAHFLAQFNLYARVDPSVFYSFIYDNTLMFALKICEQKVADTPETRKNIELLIFSGMEKVLTKAI